jgi:hypothetical protein
MPTVKQSIGIAATAFGINAVEQSTPQVPTNRFTTLKADFRLNDHQRLRKLLGIERPLR